MRHDEYNYGRPRRFALPDTDRHSTDHVPAAPVIEPVMVTASFRIGSREISIRLSDCLDVSAADGFSKTRQALCLLVSMGWEPVTVPEGWVYAWDNGGLRLPLIDALKLARAERSAGRNAQQLNLFGYDA